MGQKDGLVQDNICKERSVQKVEMGIMRNAVNVGRLPKLCYIMSVAGHDAMCSFFSIVLQQRYAITGRGPAYVTFFKISIVAF